MATKRSAADSTSAANAKTTPRKGDKSKRGTDAKGNKTDRSRSSNKNKQPQVPADSIANDAGTEPTLGRTRSKSKANRVTPGGNNGAAPPDKPPPQPQRSPNSKKKKKKQSKKERKKKSKARERIEALVNDSDDDDADGQDPTPEPPAENHDEEVISLLSDGTPPDDDEFVEEVDYNLRKAEATIRRLQRQLQIQDEHNEMDNRARLEREENNLYFQNEDDFDANDSDPPSFNDDDANENDGTNGDGEVVVQVGSEFTSWSLWLSNYRLTSWNKETLLNHIYKDKAETYWDDKLHMEQDHAEVDWIACQKALARCPTYRKLWQPKWLSGFVPTAKNLRRWKIQLSDVCPHCGNVERSTNHVLRCPSDTAKAKWAVLMTRLDEWLATSLTHPDLRRGVVETITAWYAHDPAPTISSDYTGIAATFQAQQTLGPDAFIKGILCSNWGAVQQRYYEWINTKKTGLQWTSSLIKQLWDIAWDMWRHQTKAAEEPDSATIAAEHLLLDNNITTEYQEFATVPNPPRHLSRWFARPIEAVQTEDTDFKRQWLDAVQTSKKAIAEQASQAPGQPSEQSILWDLHPN